MVSVSHSHSTSHPQIKSALKSIISIKHIQRCERRATKEEFYNVLSKGALLNNCVACGSTLSLKSFLGSPMHSQWSPKSLEWHQDSSPWEAWFPPQCHLWSLPILWLDNVQLHWITCCFLNTPHALLPLAPARTGTQTHLPCPFFLPDDSG